MVWKVTIGETRQKADRRVLENGANGGEGGVPPPECQQEKKGNIPSFLHTAEELFEQSTFSGTGQAARVRENPPAKNIFRFPIRPSSHQTSDCHRHAVTDYSRLREIRGVVCARAMRDAPLLHPRTTMSLSVIPHPFLLYGGRLTTHTHTHHGGYRGVFCFASCCLVPRLLLFASHDSSLFFIRIP